MMKNDVTTHIERALAQLKRGGLVIVTDSDHREAEGDMVGLAEAVTPAAVNTMVTHARGLLCVPMTETIADQLGIEPMVSHATDAFGTAFTISVDAKTTTTGISAFDRARTIQQLANTQATAADFYHPGHVFPLIAKPHGVLQRAGHTEAAVDLAKLAGMRPVAYITEILKKDGTMARRKDLKPFAEGMQLPMITIEEIKRYRWMHAIDAAEAMTKVHLPTKYGDFMLESFETPDQEEPTLLITKGELQPDEPLLLRVHSECLTGDVFGSLRCDCGEQLERAMQLIEAEGHGAILYLRQEGRGIGLANKLRAYQMQEQGLDTVEANVKLGFAPDARDYGLVAAILHQKHIRQVRLMTNNPDKINQLTALGVDVIERVPLEISANAVDAGYLATKKHKMQHLLKEVD